MAPIMTTDLYAYQDTFFYFSSPLEEVSFFPADEVPTAPGKGVSRGKESK